MSVARAIEHANSILPGVPVDSGEDPRWQAIIQIGEYVEANPEELWRFVVAWCGHEQEDLRNAVACVLLEHLLEYHFDLIFPRIRPIAQRDHLFADMYCRCWKFGQSELPQNASQFDEL